MVISEAKGVLNAVAKVKKVWLDCSHWGAVMSARCLLYGLALVRLQMGRPVQVEWLKVVE